MEWMPYDLRQLGYSIQKQLTPGKREKLHIIDQDGEQYVWDPQSGNFVRLATTPDEQTDSGVDVLCPNCLAGMTPTERMGLDRYLDALQAGYLPSGKLDNSLSQYLGSDYAKVQRAFSRARDKLRNCPH